jgi:hypothetical protein
MATILRKLRRAEKWVNDEVVAPQIQRMILSPSSVSENGYRLFIGRLNGRPNANTQRVAEVVEACHRVSQLMETIKSSPAPDAMLRAEAGKAMADLNALLLRYKWHPYIFGFAGSESHFRIQHAIVGEHSDPELAVEHLAIQWIIENIDTVHRVRRCHRLQCRKWFFAVVEHQKYCRNNCRQGDASKEEEFKDKRRTYMRKYRREQAELDARAKQIARGK